jgi:hypothetical protein
VVAQKQTLMAWRKGAPALEAFSWLNRLFGGPASHIQNSLHVLDRLAQTLSDEFGRAAMVAPLDGAGALLRRPGGSHAIALPDNRPSR